MLLKDMTLVCPTCGRTSDKVAFIEAFCVDCYPIKVKTPDSVQLERCKRCEKMHLQGVWVPYSPKKIADYITSKCRGDFSLAVYDVETQRAEFTIVKGDEKLKISKQIPLLIGVTICPTCSRMSGGYFEAIIQLRGRNRLELERYAAMLIRRLEKVTFITKTEEKDEGLDLYIGSSKPVMRMMVDLGVKAVISKKLVGRDQGKRLYRTTFLLRF